jgi:integrase
MHDEMNPTQPPTGKTFDPGTIPLPTIHRCDIRADMTFPEAAAVFDGWLSCHVSPGSARYRAFRTIKSHRTNIKALGKFFARMKLKDIHVGHLREYQKVRFSNERGIWAHTCGANKINAELSLLLRIMKLGGAYSAEIEKYYMELQVEEREIPKALSAEEQERFLAIAASRREWEIVYWYSLLALHIAFSSDEMRTLRQGDINLAHQIVAVNRKAGKNKYRRREVPLTDATAIWALEQLLNRSITLAGQAPEKHLFPARVCRNQFNGDFHMCETGIRKQWEAVRNAAGVPWFRLNALRHTAITRMAEAGIPIATIMARAGHCSQKMSAHYTHISRQAERLAMQRMGAPRHARPQPHRVQPPAAPATINLADPAIQMQIASQALALVQQLMAQQQPAPLSPVVRSGDQAVR